MITEFGSCSLFSVILVFVFPHVFVIVFVFSIFTMTSMTFYQSNHIPWHITKANYEGANIASRVEGRGGRFVLSINIPSTLLNGSYPIKRQKAIQTFTTP